MYYYTNEARQSAIDNITKQIKIIMETPCNIISYTDALSIVRNLSMLRDEITAEIKY